MAALNSETALIPFPDSIIETQQTYICISLTRSREPHLVHFTLNTLLQLRRIVGDFAVPIALFITVCIDVVFFSKTYIQVDSN